MTDKGTLQAILAELRRLGYLDEEMPALMLPRNVGPEEFLLLLRDIPTWQGETGVEKLMCQLLGTRLAPWDEWPDPGERFTREEYIEALTRGGFDPPERRAAEYDTAPRQLPTWLLALLSLTSPSLESRVAAYIEEVQRQRRKKGISPEVIQTAAERFEDARKRMREQMDATEKSRLDEDGPAIFFRMAPEMSKQAVHDFVFSVVPAQFWPHGVWLSETERHGTWVCMLIPKSKKSECDNVVEWLQAQTHILEVRRWPVWVWRIPQPWLQA